MPNVFISYRRDDSIATAGRIRDRLVQALGRKRVFVDVDDIPHGQDFVEVLAGKVAECSVLLAIIGPRWLDARDAAGNRRLDDQDDFVAIEIGSALERPGVVVMPVLVDGAHMPTAEMLPPRLQPLARRNAIELRNAQFGTDAERLIRAITAAGGGGGATWLPRAAGLAVVAALAGGGAYYWQHVLAPTSIEQSNRQRSVPKEGPPKSQTSMADGTAKPAAADPKADVAGALSRLREIMGPAEGRLQVGLKGGNRVRLGDQVVFEVSSSVSGRLILIDIGSRDDVTQIFPNKYVPPELAAAIPAGHTMTVPGPGYGFSGFKAVEPAGRGRILAIVQPEGVAVDRLAMISEQTPKGFEPVREPGAYIVQLVHHLADSVGERSAGTAPPAKWGYALTEYDIVPY